MSQAVLTDFRHIIRHCRSLPTFSQREMKQFVVQQFRDARLETDKSKVAHLRKLANSYAVLVNDLRESKRLRYIDTGEKLDQRDKIQATAARVGLTVPQYLDQHKSF